ncbi:MAG: DUF5067 domain-containing protein [Sporolactobacillus sp.]
MRKLFIVLSSLFLTLALSACGGNASNSSNSSTPKKTVTVAATGKKYTTNSSFKDGIFKMKGYTLTIGKTQYARDKQQDEDGLIVWFTVKNSSKKATETPESVISNLSFEQNNDTSKTDLENTFGAEDALYPLTTNNAKEYDKEVDESNAMLKIDKLSQDKILPGKTVKTFEAYELDNATHNVTVIAQDPHTLQKVGKMTIKLK